MSKVSEVRYVGYAVPDLEAERKFYYIGQVVATTGRGTGRDDLLRRRGK